MQAKSLLLGAAAGISLTALSLTIAPLASAKPGVQPPVMQMGGTTNILADNDNLFIVQNGIVYKVNKLQMLVMGRALLR